MRKVVGFAVVLTVAVGVAVAWSNVRAKDAAPTKGPKIVHSVYFSLKDSSPQGREKLIAACKKYLTKHPGEVYFAVGPLAEDLKRPVNDRDFDVALLIVFEDRQAHDRYQDAERHQQFIAENKDTWKKVRVFDSTAE